MCGETALGISRTSLVRIRKRMRDSRRVLCPNSSIYKSLCITGIALIVRAWVTITEELMCSQQGKQSGSSLRP